MDRDISSVADALSKVDGVFRVIVPSEDVKREMFRLEGEVKESSFGTPLVNEALEVARSNMECLVALCYSSFEPPGDHVIVMKGEDGRLIGYDIPPGKKSEYEGNPDLIWIGDEFVMDSAFIDQMTFVTMLPQKTDCIGSESGVCNVSIMYPSAPVDQYLRNVYGISQDDTSIATAFVSFDLLDHE